jgi:hypothetical protein
VFNVDRRPLLSAVSIKMPVCVLFPCVNSSSFMSVSSMALYDNSRLPDPLKSSLSTSVLSPSQSTVAHWIVHPRSVGLRSTRVKYNVVAAAVSPSHPQFAILAMADGAVVGFSIEAMAFTELYIPAFEGKMIRHISVFRGLTFTVAHDVLDRLDLENVQTSRMCPEKVVSCDSIDDYSAVILENGGAALLKSGKRVAVQPPIEDHTCIFAGMVSVPDWVSVFRSQLHDIVFVNSERKFVLENKFVVPKLITLYTDTFCRINPIVSYFLTADGDFVMLSGRIIPTILPSVPFKLAVAQPSGVFLLEQLEGKVAFHHLANFAYVERREIDGSLPIAWCGDDFLLVSDNSLAIYSWTESATRPLLALDSAISRLQVSPVSIDIILESGTHLWSGPGWEFTPSRHEIADDVAMWRRICQSDSSTFSVATINCKCELVLEKRKEKVCKDIADLITFEVIDTWGRPSSAGSFIVVVTVQSAILYEPNRLKQLKKRSFRDPPLAVIFSRSGTLIVQFAARVEIWPLPDVSRDCLGTLALPQATDCLLIDPVGLLLVGKEPRVAVYTPDAEEAPPLFAEDEQPLSEPPIVRKKLFGKQEIPKPSVAQTDARFKFQRATGALAETQDIMQELLVVAQQRSEVLSEMEVKAERLKETAKAFRANVRRFRK